MAEEVRSRSNYKPSKGLGLYFSAEEDLSDADRVARLPLAEQNALMEGVDLARLQYDDTFWCRKSQLAFINSTTPLTVALAGRGWGKSFALSKAMHKYAMTHPKSRLALIGRTSADVRDVMIMGESGLMNVVPEDERPEYIPNARKLLWPNGTRALTFCVDDTTEALTRDRGWVTHSNLAEGDFIYALDTEKRMGVWTSLRSVNKFQVIDEKMMLCDGPSHSSLSTMGHHWPVHPHTDSFDIVWMTSEEILMSPGDGPIGVRAPCEWDFSGRSLTTYTGTVWCPTTDTGTWLARRRGKVYFTGNSAERPDAIRGSEQHAAFVDEAAAYRQNKATGLVNALDQVRFSCRLGDNPQIWVATTPKRNEIVLGIVREAEERPGGVTLIRGSTLANRHLSQSYQDTVLGLYEGTTLGAQEISGEILTDVDGALLYQSVIDMHRTPQYSSVNAPDFWRSLPMRAVGVDPSVSATPNDECGIIVMGATGERKLEQRQAYVLEDASILGSPDQWARRAVNMARKYEAPIIAEANQGGELVRLVIKGIDPKVPVLLVHAKVGKFERAEPVAAAYQRGRVHHVDEFEVLESQWTGWAPGQGLSSPDRLDACVWCATALLVVEPKGFFGRVEVSSRGSTRHITTVVDHTPFSPLAAIGAGGVRNLEAVKQRLLIMTDIPEEDLNPPAEDEIGGNLFRTRPNRLQLPMSSSSTQGNDHLYGPPNRFRAH
jgi:phage terminase large subunit-like protein